jgi:hypothetical protein
MNNTKSIYYPPGGILIWIIIYLELITFGMAILALAYYGSEERELFHSSSLKLNKTIGTINTILLLTSGFFVAKGIHFFDRIDSYLKDGKTSLKGKGENMAYKFNITRGNAILNFSEEFCQSRCQLIESESFAKVLEKYIKHTLILK